MAMGERISGNNSWRVRIQNAFKEALFPAKCLVCGAFLQSKIWQGFRSAERDIQRELFLERSLTDVFKLLLGPFLCSTCLTGFLPVASPLCSVCGFMFTSREGEDHVCGDCLEFPKKFKTARSTGVYDRAFMDVIYCFKYKGKIQLARPLGMLLFFVLVNNWSQNSIDLVLPVPLHPKKIRSRGFNQAFLLVRDWAHMAAKFQIELPFKKIDHTLLVRNKWTEQQTGLGREKRISNVNNVFALDDRTTISDKKILLVDDVYTTGATVNECANVLIKGGARHVNVLTLARAI